MSDDFRARVAAALAPAYTLERELVGGGMSRVFVATEQALGRTVVVKVLSPELSAGVNRDRFRRDVAGARLVFLGVGLDAASLHAALDACVADPAASEPSLLPMLRYEESDRVDAV